MTTPVTQKTYEVFLSHATPDKDWVKQLETALAALGVKSFLDAKDLVPGQPFPEGLSDGLRDSRFLALVLSQHSVNRPWVTLEWTAFQAEHGPLDRVIPIYIEQVELPTILKSIQGILAFDRDVDRVAQELARLVAKQLPERSVPDVGAKFTFVVETMKKETPNEASSDAASTVLRVTDRTGKSREVTPPWLESNAFGVAHLQFETQAREPADTDALHADLHRHASTLGRALFAVLFGEPPRSAETDSDPELTALREQFREALKPDVLRPVLEIVSDGDQILSLPWELVQLDGDFLVRSGRVDLLRTTTDRVGSGLLLREPDRPFDLVVNISAPTGSGLDYEAESFRITKALLGECRLTPTELGTVDDLVLTLERERPRGVHFSGHGGPGTLLFEDDEGEEAEVAIGGLVERLRQQTTEALPPFFYLACCHGNDPGRGKRGAESAAARLHREGIAQVVAYSGPIVDALSTRAEAELYGAIAKGLSTRDAVRLARTALGDAKPIEGDRHRPRCDGDDTATASGHSFPFAWAQIVFYHRGPDWPLSTVQAGDPDAQDAPLERTFEGTETRKRLSTGFIGRRRDLHRVRKALRDGERIFVFQGLGGLGKSTLAFHTLPILAGEDRKVFDFWCQETEKHDDPLAPLCEQMLDHLGRCFGEAERASIAHAVDQKGETTLERFGLLLRFAVEKLPGVVLYFDNLESLLAGPERLIDEDNPELKLADWQSEDLRRWWQSLCAAAHESGKVHLVASTRYMNTDLEPGLLSVSPLPPDALYRLMRWFPALRRLSVETRLRLVEQLAGHPRAVEYLSDLVADALGRHERRHGTWSLPDQPTEADLEREWAELVAPALPKVEGQVRANLLLQQIWENVLDEPQRRMLYRMTLLRRPWEWSLMAALGEPSEVKEVVETRAEGLRNTSLLERMQVSFVDRSGNRTELVLFLLHPSTARFVRATFTKNRELTLDAHRRIGGYLEAEAKTSPWIETDLEAGHHLFQACELNRAYDLLGAASEWLQNRGCVHQGLTALEPFLEQQVLSELTPQRQGRLFGTMGNGCSLRGEVRKAIEFFEQALGVARETGDRKREGYALGGLGNCFVFLGETSKAIQYYEQSLVIARQTGDREGASHALGNLGNSYGRLGDTNTAVERYEQSLVIAREIGSRRDEGTTLGNLGIAYHRRGEVRKAIECFMQSLEIARGVGNRQSEGDNLGNLGIAYGRLEEFRKASEYHERSLAISRETGNLRTQGQDLNNLGLTYAHMGEMKKAIHYYELRLRMARQIGDRHGEGLTLCNLGIAHAGLSEIEKARDLLCQSLAIGREIGDPQMVQNAEGALRELTV